MILRTGSSMGGSTESASYLINRPKFLKLLFSEMRTSATVFEGYGSYLREERDMTYININKRRIDVV